MKTLRRWAADVWDLAGALSIASLVIVSALAFLIAATWPLWAGLAALKFLFS